jgi:maleate isomerase
MDVSFLGGPHPQRGVGVVAPFDFALDRELWRWVPDEVSLHLTRTPFVPVEVSLDLARLVSEHETLGDAVRTLNAVAPEIVAYACTSGSFVGGIPGERAMCEAMTRAGEVPSVTTSGALLEALEELGARRIASSRRTPSP